MIDIEKPKIEIAEISDDNRYGKFICEPLERGYGTTFGNSLRRMLLSSLEGAAVTSIRIEGVLHEFSTIPGVRDDVTNIVLNLKQLCLKMEGSEPKVIRIDVEGEKEVTAADIICDADIEVLNPDLHIATLNEDGKLKIEMTVERGRGYVPADKNKKPASSPSTPSSLRCSASTTRCRIPVSATSRTTTSSSSKSGRMVPFARRKPCRRQQAFSSCT